MSQSPFDSSLSLSRQPFLYLSGALIAGILVDRWTEVGLASVVVAASLATAVASRLILAKRDSSATVALILSFVVAGTFLSHADRTSESPSRLSRLFDSRFITPDDQVELTGTLAAPPEPAPESSFIDVEAESVRIRDESTPASGRARLSISLGNADALREFEQLALDYGCRIRVLVRLERARHFSNPGSPDFNEFLERRGYDLKGVIKSPLLIERVDEASTISLFGLLLNIRLRLMTAIDSRFKPRVAGMLKAMLAGNRYFLDRETTERLREGSTFHTLVIAGLHIGIIAWALLGGRSALKRRRVWRVMLCVMALWAYAVMVGLAPPVTRATTMITIGLTGPLLFRRAASINTLALAAFVMLALKPALVADPGFQLSFAAVAGIVGLALPLAEKLRRIGEWRPTSHTPHPPECSRAVRSFAESLFWDARAFEAEMRHAPIRYRLDKSAAAGVPNRWRIQRLVRAVVLLMITSSAIQLATLPLMALYFNRVAPVGVMLNIFAGLLTGVLMLSGLAAIVVGMISSSAASLLEHAVNATRDLLVNAIVPFSQLPLATFRVAHHEGWHAVVYALYFVPLAMLVVLIDRWQPVDYIYPVKRAPERDKITPQTPETELPARSSFRARFAQVLCAVSLTSAIIAVIQPPVRVTTGKLTIHFLDVGQGDAALIVFPRGKTMLVDGGGELRFNPQGNNSVPRATDSAYENEPFIADSGFSIGEAVVSRFIWSLGRTSIDYALATHAHADHIGGLADVARSLDVREAIVGYAPARDPEYERFANAAHQRGIPICTVSAGETFEIDGVTIEVLWPPPPAGGEVTSGNDDSVVLRLVYGSVSILLAGDVEQRTERALVRSRVDLQAVLLKVPHHGSNTSSTDPFIDAVDPTYAVISVGERSRFGHPHPSVVKRFLARGVRLFQTGRDGMVTVESDGARINISGDKN